MDNLQSLFKTAVASAADNRGKPGILGRVDGTLHWVSASGTVHRDKVWVRVGEAQSRQEVVASCYNVSPQYDLPVRVDNVNGALTVISTDTKRAEKFSGNRPGFNVPAHAFVHGRSGPDPIFIEGLQVLPLLVTTTTPASMAVTVQGGAYRWLDEMVIFEKASSSSLTSYLPADNTVKHFVIICLDRDSNAIAIVDGGDIASTGGDALFPGEATITPADVLAIDIEAHYLPLAAVLLYYGQTAVRLADIVMDLRLWGMESGDKGATWRELAATPDTPATGKWGIYFLSDGLYLIDDAGTEYGPLGKMPDPAFASIHNHDSSTAQTIPTGTAYTKLTNFTDGGYGSNCISDAANDKITITSTGNYYVSGSFNFQDDTNNTVWRLCLFVDGAEFEEIHIKMKIGIAGDVVSASFCGIIDVSSVPIDIDVRARHDSGFDVDITVEYANLTAHRIRELWQ